MDNSLQVATAGQQNMQRTLSHNNNLPALSKQQKALANEARALTLAGNPSFPIPNLMLAEYAIIISEENPEITPLILKKMCRMMMTGKIPYDPNKGIRNIFDGFKEYIRHRKYCKVFNVDTCDMATANEDTPDTIDKSAWKVFDDYCLNSISDKVRFGISLGFEYIDRHDKDQRERYLRSCASKGIEPQPFDVWLENRSVEAERIQKENEKREQQRLQALEDAKNAEITEYTDEELDF